MKKQKNQLLLLFIILAVLVIAYIGIRFYNQKQEEKEAADEAAEVIQVTDIAVEDITAFSYAIGDNTYSFRKNDETWICNEEADVALDTTEVEGLLKKVNALTAEERIEKPEGLSAYGLDYPDEITISTADGDTVIFLGNQNAITSRYYIKTGNSDEVYLITENLTSSFSVTPDDLAVDEEETETAE